jgi:hypothetical protein
MIKKLALLAVALSLVACNALSNATIIDPKTESVSIVYPDSGTAKLRLNLGVGSLKVAPGGDQLVEGAITYNVKEWAPETQTEGNTVTLKQGGSGLKLNTLGNTKNDWVLKLGTARPYELEIDNGVARADLALGGLPLTKLSVDGGVGEINVTLDKFNPQVADTVKLNSGVGRVQVTGLLNANAKQITADSGAGELVLSFTGDSLKQDLAVAMNAGVGGSTINVKKGVPTRVIVKQGVGKVTGQGGDFTLTSDDVYTTVGFDTATGPKITINLEMGVGNVRLNTMD